MRKIGITGGIGSGKSVISHLLRIMGVPVYIADDESKKLTNTSFEIREKLVACFGESLYDNQTLNKAMLASLIFSNEENLSCVNQIIHPIVLNHFIQWTNMQQTALVAMESAILFESGFNQYMDTVITVTAPAEMRIRRVLSRDNITREQVLQRISSQWQEDEKVNLSTHIIINDDKCAIISQLEKILLIL